MNDGDALLKTIILEPENDVVRLVYADWLEENGRAERAEFIRVQIEMAQIHSEADPRKGLFTEDGKPKYKDPPLLGRWKELDARQRELFHSLYSDKLPGPFVPNLDGHIGRNAPHAHYHRGFVDAITLTAKDFFSYVDDLLWKPDEPLPLMAQPIQNVIFLSWPNWSFNEYGCGFVGRKVKDQLLGGDHDRRTIATRMFKKEWPNVECKFPRETSLLNGNLIAYETNQERLIPGTAVVFDGNLARVAQPGEKADGYVASSTPDGHMSILINMMD